MHGGYDEVQFGEDIVVVVEGTVPEDVDLRSAEEMDLTVAVVGLPHGLHLLLQALGRKTVRHPEATGVVAEDEVLVAELDSRLGHALDGAFAVRVVGVNVQVPTDIFDGDEVGQSASVCGFDLAGVLPQLRRYVGEAEPRVEILLRGHGFVVAGPRLGQAVLGDVDTHLDGPLAQRDVVGLAAGEVVQERAVGLGFDYPQIYLGPAAKDKDLLRAVGQDFLGERRLCEVVGERVGVLARGDDVDVADGLLHAAQGAADLGPIRRRVRADEREDLLPQRSRFVQEHPAFRRVVRPGGVHHLLCALLPETLEGGDPLRVNGCEFFDIGDAQLLPKASDRARPDARQARYLDEAFWYLGRQVGE